VAKIKVTITTPRLVALPQNGCK